MNKNSYSHLLNSEIRHWMQGLRELLSVGVCFSAVLAPAADALLPSDAPSSINSFPFSQLGAKATADYHGEALGVELFPGGVRLRTGFQKLVGTVTAEGLVLDSMSEGSGSLRLSACALGREGVTEPLPITGEVRLQGQIVSWDRPGISEEFSVSADGLRQDFVVSNRPTSEGDVLHLELALSGAQAETITEGVKFTLTSSGRELAYTKLHVTDAVGKTLASKLEVVAVDRLRVLVWDTEAVYPLRIDPTFSDANWVSLSAGITGANGTISATVVDASGNLYVGGAFTFIGSAAANNIAKWNGTSWSALGLGVSSGVNALVVDASGNLYAGGNFTTAGGSPANSIAKWNGSAWSALGSGTNGTTFALALDTSGNLYAGGQFNTAGGSSASCIAKWNGSSWNALGAGLSSLSVAQVQALKTDASGNLYVGGTFTTAGSISASNIAKWDGGTWSTLGSGVNNTVYALTIDSIGNLYVGGDFTTASGASASRIAKWNGSAWSALGSGVNSTVSALVTDSNGNLYAGGNFSTAGGSAANRIAKWSGSAWLAMGTGLNNRVFSLTLDPSGNLYVGGNFTTAGGSAANSIAKWNGSAWSALGTGISNIVKALAVDTNGNLYVGGDFIVIGGAAANRIAKWNGSFWSTLGSGMSSTVNALAVDVSGNLYAGGLFTTAGGITVNRVAKWDGVTWSALGTGVNNVVYSLATDTSGNLYVGGDLSAASGTTVSKVAKWNGSTWSALGSGISGGLGRVYALAADNNGNLYAGGFFTTAGGISASNIAQWDGSVWSALGAGSSQLVYALAVNANGDVYAGGDSRVAKWSGSAWSTLNGVTGTVFALTLDGSGNLYAGGSFNPLSTSTVNRVAKWDGSAWSTLGTGTNGDVNALARDSFGHLFVGGSFSMVGTTVSPNIAQGNLFDTPTTISSLNILNSTPSKAATLNWRLTFSAATSGVTASNFNLSGSASTGAVVGTPTTGDGGVTWNVPVTTGSSDGALTLNMANSAGLSPSTSTTLPFAGQSYMMDKTAPTISIGVPSASSVNQGDSASFTVTYMDTNFNDSTLSAGSITLNSTGSASGGIAISGTGFTRTVTINSVSGNGTLGISIVAGTASDTAGNTSPAAGPSTTFNVLDVPSIPTIGTATRGNASASVSFSAPASNGGSAITSYTVTSTPGGITAAGSVSPITVTGLTNGTTYVFTVAAANSVGTGLASAASNAVTPLSLLQIWRQTNFGSITNSGNSANMSDNDSDGIPNLLEFSFGTNPAISSNAPLSWSGAFASATFGSNGQPVVASEPSINGADLRALYIRRADYIAAGLNYTVEFSSDLSVWVPSTATHTILSISGDYQLVSVPFPINSGTNERFFRVSVNTTQ